MKKIVLGLFCFAAFFSFAMGQVKVDYALAYKNMNQEVMRLLRPYQLSQVRIATPETQGNTYFQQGQFKKALPIQFGWAVQGNRRAMLEVGFMYEFGKGTQQNYKQAALWYYQAVELNAYNHRPMQRGLKYYLGLGGVKVDYKAAAMWFRMAAELSYDRY